MQGEEEEVKVEYKLERKSDTRRSGIRLNMPLKQKGRAGEDDEGCDFRRCTFGGRET